MVGEFALMLLHVREGTVEPLLFSLEEHEANCASRLHSRTHDGIGSSQHTCRARPVVRASFGEIPGVQVSANNQNLFGILAATNFSDHIGAVHRSIGERILNIEAGARGDSGIYVALELALIFGGHGHYRDGEVRVKAENSGVRQIQPTRLCASLPADITSAPAFAAERRKSPKRTKIISPPLRGFPFATINAILPFSLATSFISRSRSSTFTGTISASTPLAAVEPVQPMASTCSL